jgi:hypothetical protein
MRALGFSRQQTTPADEIRAAAVPHVTLGKNSKARKDHNSTQRRRNTDSRRVMELLPCPCAWFWQCSGIRRLTRYDRCVHDNLLVRNFFDRGAEPIAPGLVRPRRG